MDITDSILLLGGNGFLGQGLQSQFNKRGITFDSIDIDDCDFSSEKCIPYLVDQFQNHSKIVLLASKIGAKLFRDKPQQSACINQHIFNNVMTSLIKNNMPIQFSYYSSCEIFGSRSSQNDFISKDSSILPVKSLRKLYSQIKYESECNIRFMHDVMPNIIKEYKIFRPFNVSGLNQRRGVVFEMVQSAINNNQIHYSSNTTRTFTSLDIASELACDALISPGNGIYHLVDPRNSIWMKTLAGIIKDILETCYGFSNVELIETQPDLDIQFRNVGEVDKNICYMTEELHKIVKDILHGQHD